MSRKLGKCKICGKETCRPKYEYCHKCRGILQRKLKINSSINSKDYRKIYAREWSLKKKYNIDINEFNIYWIAQRGKCYICETKMFIPKNRQGQALNVVAVDHCHKTGKFRALLCNKCNKGLGFFNDNIILMKHAIKYLEVING